jgi:hypothetical protein
MKAGSKPAFSRCPRHTESFQSLDCISTVLLNLRTNRPFYFATHREASRNPPRRLNAAAHQPPPAPRSVAMLAQTATRNPPSAGMPSLARSPHAGGSITVAIAWRFIPFPPSPPLGGSSPSSLFCSLVVLAP